MDNKYISSKYESCVPLTSVPSILQKQFSFYTAGVPIQVGLGVGSATSSVTPMIVPNSDGPLPMYAEGYNPAAAASRESADYNGPEMEDESEDESENEGGCCGPTPTTYAVPKPAAADINSITVQFTKTLKTPNFDAVATPDTEGSVWTSDNVYAGHALSTAPVFPGQFAFETSNPGYSVQCLDSSNPHALIRYHLNGFFTYIRRATDHDTTEFFMVIPTNTLQECKHSLSTSFKNKEPTAYDYTNSPEFRILRTVITSYKEGTGEPSVVDDGGTLTPNPSTTEIQVASNSYLSTTHSINNYHLLYYYVTSKLYITQSISTDTTGKKYSSYVLSGKTVEKNSSGYYVTFYQNMANYTNIFPPSDMQSSVKYNVAIKVSGGRKSKNVSLILDYATDGSSFNHFYQISTYCSTCALYSDKKYRNLIAEDPVSEGSYSFDIHIKDQVTTLYPAITGYQSPTSTPDI